MSADFGRPAGARSPRHWDAIYQDRGPTGVSWYQAEPRMSLDLITGLGIDQDTPVLDAGGGASSLAARLASRGFTDITIVDISETALATARHNLGAGVDATTWIAADLLAWRPVRRYGLWHDRAVFHFLTDPGDRAAYLATLRSALLPGGIVILATFAADGPAQCSGLPVTRYTGDELAAQLTAAFNGELDLLDRRTERHRTPGGGTQPFTWLAARAR